MKRYEDTLIYKLDCDSTAQINEGKPKTYTKLLPLTEVEKKIQKICNLTDNMKQVVYMVGWQKGGHDFAYPYPHRTGFNEKLGTPEGFRNLSNRLRQKNVSLSLHDNFDDAYLSEDYCLNREIMAEDNVGDMFKGWLWAGGMSYIVSPCAYVDSAEIEERIAAVKEIYGIQDTYHLDVMSSEVKRYDFSDTHPAAACENLEAKLKIIDKFADQGIDVTSETLAFPFVGKIGFANNTRYKFGNELFYGEKIIPLTTIAMHGVMPYSMDVGDRCSLLRAIACGGGCQVPYKGTEAECTANIFLCALPMNKLAYKKAVDAEMTENEWNVWYEDDSSVTVNYEKQTYRIVLEGKVISENFTSFVEVDGKYYFFSEDRTQCEVVVPEHWRSVSISSLSFEGRGEAVVAEVQKGKVMLHIKTKIPYVIEEVIGSQLNKPQIDICD